MEGNDLVDTVSVCVGAGGGGGGSVLVVADVANTVCVFWSEPESDDGMGGATVSAGSRGAATSGA